VPTARRRPRAVRHRADVFVNLPFDSQHETLFVATIAGLVALGLNPRCVLEVPPQQDRVRRLFEIVRECPFSIHDLSRVQVSRAGEFRVPRFNMPFELGLAVAVSLADAAAGRAPHQWRTLEAKRFRLAASLSDISGYDGFVHHGTVAGTFEALLDIFAGLKHRPLHDAKDLHWVFRRLRQFQFGHLKSGPFGAKSFRELVWNANILVDERRRQIGI
jgi:hypothetical protein